MDTEQDPTKKSGDPVLVNKIEGVIVSFFAAFGMICFIGIIIVFSYNIKTVPVSRIDQMPVADGTQLYNQMKQIQTDKENQPEKEEAVKKYSSRENMRGRLRELFGFR